MTPRSIQATHHITRFHRIHWSANESLADSAHAGDPSGGATIPVGVRAGVEVEAATPLAGAAIAADRPRLTRREQEILCLVSEALSNADIAAQLFITIPTVKRHLTNLYAKLNAVSRVDAIRKATAVRLLEPMSQDGLTSHATSQPASSTTRVVELVPEFGRRPTT